MCVLKQFYLCHFVLTSSTWVLQSFSPFRPFYPLKTPLLNNGWGDPLSLCIHCCWFYFRLFALFTPSRLHSWTTGGGIHYPSSDIVTGFIFTLSPFSPPADYLP
ncbi:hypothetical protein PILCRDRAFT_612793 [Piloderma croceum F 1598]|uniref:Uncharacterized protein n=1 Tax=Piloderma croceum (strain F 1598) TaxID=765440 RepID=A0A0C3AUT3_PILCF|nr:hypothetical protein PILCRDRAFT_612793 [Piloderma croceum F 1598]